MKEMNRGDSYRIEVYGHTIYSDLFKYINGLYPGMGPVKGALVRAVEIFKASFYFQNPTCITDWTCQDSLQPKDFFKNRHLALLKWA